MAFLLPPEINVCLSLSTKGFLLFDMYVDLNEPKRKSKEDFFGWQIEIFHSIK